MSKASNNRNGNTTTSYWGMLLYIVVCALVFIVLLEVGLRYRGTYTTHVELNGGEFFSAYETFGGKDNWIRPTERDINVDYQEFNYTFTTNSLGLRDVERTVEKSDSVKRILLLGDSFIESFGSPNDSTISVLLQQYINSDSSLQYRYEVMNGGVAGSDLFFSYHLLKSELLKFSPDLVVLNLNFTDVNDYMVRGTYDRFADDGSIFFRESPIDLTLYRFSRVYRIWVHFIQGRSTDTFLTPEEEAAYRASFASDAETLLDSMEMLANANNFNFYWLKQPLSKDVELGHLPDAIAAITYPHSIDMLQPISNRVATVDTLTYWPIDGHFTPAGYAFYAQLVKDSLVQRGAIK